MKIWCNSVYFCGFETFFTKVPFPKFDSFGGQSVEERKKLCLTIKAILVKLTNLRVSEKCQFVTCKSHSKNQNKLNCINLNKRRSIANRIKCKIITNIQLRSSIECFSYNFISRWKCIIISVLYSLQTNQLQLFSNSIVSTLF